MITRIRITRRRINCRIGRSGKGAGLNRDGETEKNRSAAGGRRPGGYGNVSPSLAQLCGATESGGGALRQFLVSRLSDGKAEAGRRQGLCDSAGLGWSLPGGSVVADGMEVSAVRKNIWQPVVDAALHQLRFEQGRSGGGGAEVVPGHGFARMDTDLET
jgi:hypothetical protein